ncbi:MAG TPA: YetF domain-containing protein [Acidimicrobiales bacterium]
MQRVSLDDLEMAARRQGIADLRDTRLAVLEPEGNFSLLERSGEPSWRDEGHSV